MSKNFEGEYKEYLNAQAPDLWDRIEAGIDADKVVPISAQDSKNKKKKRKIRYQNYRMIASVAACLFALVIIVPVYMLTQSTGKDSAAKTETPHILADATIQNIEVTNADNSVVAEEAAPAENVTEDTAEIEIALEETAEDVKEFAQESEGTSEASITESEDAFDELAETEGAGQLASVETEAVTGEAEPDVMTEADVVTETAEEEAAPAQEELQVKILAEGQVQEDGVMYKAEMTDGTSTTSVMLLVLSGNDIVLEAEKSYVLTAKQSESGDYYIVMTATISE